MKVNEKDRAAYKDAGHHADSEPDISSISRFHFLLMPWITSKFWLLIFWRSGTLSMGSWPMMFSGGDAGMPGAFFMVSRMVEYFLPLMKPILSKNECRMTRKLLVRNRWQLGYRCCIRLLFLPSVAGWCWCDTWKIVTFLQVALILRYAIHGSYYRSEIP